MKKDECQDILSLRSVSCLTQRDKQVLQNAIAECGNGKTGEQSARISPAIIDECINHIQKLEDWLIQQEQELNKEKEWLVQQKAELKRVLEKIRQEEKMTEADIASKLRKLSVGDIITFGHYEQDEDPVNSVEEIEWQVLDIQGNRALLLSKYGLDAKPYHEFIEDVTWETSTLRYWLNQEFLSTAFYSLERSRILETTIKTKAEYNSFYGKIMESNTQDFIFLLSSSEAEKYFPDDVSRQCKPTSYAKQKEIWTDSESGNSWWWLRSRGWSGILASGVNSSGAVFERGFSVDNDKFVVRPALWISLNG